jgi:hypothetical protein
MQIFESRFTLVKYLILALFILLQVYLIFIKKHLTLVTDVFPNAQPTPSIFGDRKIGQTFVSDKDNLSQIDLMLGTYGRENDRDVVFQLWEFAPEKKLVLEKVFNASNVRNNLYNPIEVRPQKKSRYKKYYFLLYSPESSLDNSICAWMNEEDIYREGNFILDNQDRDGDLVFRVYSKRPVYTELGRIVRNYPGILGNVYFLILAIIFFIAVQILVLSKLLDFMYKNLRES